MKFFNTCKLLNERLIRRTTAIQDYDIQIEHCPGRDNLVANTLSRLPVQENSQKMGHNDSKIILYALVNDLRQIYETDCRILAKSRK